MTASWKYRCSFCGQETRWVVNAFDGAGLVGIIEVPSLVCIGLSDARHRPFPMASSDLIIDGVEVN